MTLSPHQLLIFACLIIGLVTLTATWLRPVAVKAPPPLSAEVSEWFAVNTTNITIAKDGLVKHQVHAERLMHYDKLEKTDFIKPYALMFNPNTPAWQLRADAGTAYHENTLEEMEELDFSGNVVIWREAAPDLPRSEMQTEFLKFFPEKDFVETDQAVTFTYGQHTMSGVGMWANLNTQQVQLLNDVTGKYIHE